MTICIAHCAPATTTEQAKNYLRSVLPSDAWELITSNTRQFISGSTTSSDTTIMIKTEKNEHANQVLAADPSLFINIVCFDLPEDQASQ